MKIGGAQDRKKRNYLNKLSPVGALLPIRSPLANLFPHDIYFALVRKATHFTFNAINESQFIHFFPGLQRNRWRRKLNSSPHKLQ